MKKYRFLIIILCLSVILAGCNRKHVRPLERAEEITEIPAPTAAIEEEAIDYNGPECSVRLLFSMYSVDEIPSSVVRDYPGEIITVPSGKRLTFKTEQGYEFKISLINSETVIIDSAAPFGVNCKKSLLPGDESSEFVLNVGETVYLTASGTADNADRLKFSFIDDRGPGYASTASLLPDIFTEYFYEQSDIRFHGYSHDILQAGDVYTVVLDHDMNGDGENDDICVKYSCPANDKLEAVLTVNDHSIPISAYGYYVCDFIDLDSADSYSELIMKNYIRNEDGSETEQDSTFRYDGTELVLFDGSSK